jgi:hypothetical protein
MPELATEDQRWQIHDLFAHFGILSMDQVRADASRILKLESPLTDLRELTREDADELIAELRRAVAAERVSDG